MRFPWGREPDESILSGSSEEVVERKVKFVFSFRRMCSYTPMEGQYSGY